MDHPGLQFDDPVDMLLFLDDDLLEGHYTLYPWQVQILKDFAIESTAKDPFQAVACAANGSGKDKFLIAACALWLVIRYKNAVSVVTSKSGTQLDRQTNTYIAQLANSINSKLGFEFVKINYRHYEVQFPQTEDEKANGKPASKSTIELFVTDEAGRAEGWHPIVHNGQLGIFSSEAKSIDESIFEAFARCTGFTKRMDVSSPGLPMGHFFNMFTSGTWRKYKITAFDCPHIPASYIEQCRINYGEGSALYKSMILAEFGTTDEQVVIPYHLVWNAMYSSRIGHLPDNVNTAGLDLAAGGDETVLVVRNGNKVIAVEGFRCSDTTQTVDRLELLFKQHSLVYPTSYIYGDAGGLGKPILDELRNRRKWYNIKYVLNNHEPRDKRAYHNRGVENWFTFKNFLESGEIILVPDERLKQQLTSRYYKQIQDGPLQLESKLQARAKGHPSPDRADACVLAFSSYKTKLVDGVEKADHPLPPKPVPPEVQGGDFTLREHAKRTSEPSDLYSGYYGSPSGRAPIRNQEHLQTLIADYNKAIKNKKVEAVCA